MQLVYKDEEGGGFEDLNEHWKNTYVIYISLEATLGPILLRLILHLGETIQSALYVTDRRVRPRLLLCLKLKIVHEQEIKSDV